MSAAMLDNGRPVLVPSDRAHPGRGPWARLLATTVVPDEGSARAERGRVLARSGHVHSVAIEPGRISARVIGSGGAEYDVVLTAGTIAPRTWAAVSSSPRTKALLATNEQSVHLQHELLVDWDAPLVPRTQHVRRSCTCPDAGYSEACKHVAALAYVVAAAIDHDPALLLRFRGCDMEAPLAGTTTSAAPVASAEHWQGGRLPEPLPTRALPVAAVLKRLGRSGIHTDNDELVDVLRPAYAAFATGGGPSRGDI